MTTIISQLFMVSNCFSLFEDISRVEKLFDRTLLYGYELPSFFPSQTLIIVFYEQDILDIIMIMNYITKTWTSRSHYETVNLGQSSSRM